ncbi:L,D-transpeptidase [Microbacterium sp. HD4P20]|uniref:L,D-transpeptidase n=1 Tax=Microbacterium sp. HD4P20 TaxID=2864874 RepID=UPI001C6408A2|nr:L,D-transpeptidase [Microbacterium sp. HD4P20]MCP2637185.1 L,D-transpeptidase [Microbacterium sp. HD4P20]
MGDESIANGVPAERDAGGGRRRALWWALAGAAVFVIAAIVVGVLRGMPAQDAAATPSPSSTATTTPTPAPAVTPTPTVAGFPQNANPYDVSTLPQVNVFAVIPQLPVDDAPFAAATAERALPLGVGAPVWADPLGEPVAYLPREYSYDGTTVPIVERQEHWVKVLLTGRQAVPSQGNAAQVAGWMRVSDVELAPAPESVVVSISARTIDIVRDGVAERIADDFAWGTAATPTPLGRAYIMTTRVVPEYGYTRGHPIVYLSVQSPTLDGFGGADAAVTAFHYHDERSGAISNGCLRVDPDAITRLAALPHGTPVIVNP